MLSKRESEILNYVALGITAKEIASLLSLAMTTVQDHVKNIKAKLNANNNCHMVYLALKNCLISFD